MKSRYFLTICFFFFLGISTLEAQYTQTKGAVQAGMGGAALFNNDVWAVFNNQAMLAKTHGLSAGVYFSDRFALPELAEKAAAVSFGTDKYGTAGISYTGFGTDAFKTDKFGFAYGKQLGKRFYAGMQMSWLTLHQSELYPTVSALTGEFSFLAEPTSKFFVAGSVSNPWRAKLSPDTQTDYLATIFKLGVGFKFAENVLYTAHAEKDLDIRSASLHTGLDYNIIAGLSIRAGVSVSQSFTEYHFGVGYKWKGISLDFAYSQHPYLGYTPHASLGYVLSKK